MLVKCCVHDDLSPFGVAVEPSLGLNYFLSRNFYLKQPGQKSVADNPTRDSSPDGAGMKLSMAVKKAVYKNVFLTMLSITIVNMLSLIYWSSGNNGSFNDCRSSESIKVK